MYFLGCRLSERLMKKQTLSACVLHSRKRTFAAAAAYPGAQQSQRKRRFSRTALATRPTANTSERAPPQHVVGRVHGDGTSLYLVSQQELQDLVTHALSGHVDRLTSPSVVQLQVCAVEEEESGGVIATVEGREEEWRLALLETQS